MRNSSRSSSFAERGQVLILLVLGIAGFLGFTALAIDGGMIYAERRRAQNAADAAALSGALAKIRGDDWQAAALDRAASNDYDNGGTENIVEVYSPPVSGPLQGDGEYVQVVITNRVQTAFMHFVYSGQVENTVEAVARARPEIIQGIYEGDAIVGLNPHGCSVVRAGGNSDTLVQGGSIFVNSDDPDCAYRQHGSGEVEVPAPGAINVVGGWDYDGNAHDIPNVVRAAINTGADQIALPLAEIVPPPTCTDAAVKTGSTLSPGYYSGNIFPPNGVTQLGDPDDDSTKIYCVDVTNKFSLNNQDLTGHNVMIYLIRGDLDWNGNADITLDAPDEGIYAGMLLYVNPDGYTNPPNRDIQINGSSDSSLVGTIYAPAASVTINGNNSSTGGYRSQVIGYTVELVGGADLFIDYDPDQNYKDHQPAKIDLSQ